MGAGDDLSALLRLSRASLRAAPVRVPLLWVGLLMLLKRVRDDIEGMRAQTGVGPCSIVCRSWVYHQLLQDVLDVAQLDVHQDQVQPVLFLVFDTDIEVDDELLEADCVVRFEEDDQAVNLMLDLQDYHPDTRSCYP